MHLHSHKGALVVGAIGTVVVVAHLALAVALSLTLSEWLSGAAIGLVLVVAAVLHIAFATHRRGTAPQPPG